MLSSHFSRKPFIIFLSNSRRSLSHVTATPTRAPIPSISYQHNYGLMKVSLALTASIFLGSTIAKLGAASLEENEIFVHYDDEEDD